MDIDEVQRLAGMARIATTSEEAEVLGAEIESVLAYVSVVNELIAEQDATKKPGAVYNVLREDVVTNESGAATRELLAEAPDREGSYLKVKKILTQD